MEILHDPELRKLLSEFRFSLTEQITYFASLFNEFADELNYIVTWMHFLDNSICTGLKYKFSSECKNLFALSYDYIL